MDIQGYQPFVLATQHVAILESKVTKEFSRTVLSCLFQHGFVQVEVWGTLIILFRKSEVKEKHEIFFPLLKKGEGKPDIFTFTGKNGCSHLENKYKREKKGSKNQKLFEDQVLSLSITISNISFM